MVSQEQQREHQAPEELQAEEGFLYPAPKPAGDFADPDIAMLYQIFRGKQFEPKECGLSPNQQRFLAVRPYCYSDRAAALKAGVHYTNPPEWKKKSALFRKLYNAIPTVDIALLIAQAQQDLMGSVPAALQNLITLATSELRWKVPAVLTQQRIAITDLLTAQGILKKDADTSKDKTRKLHIVVQQASVSRAAKIIEAKRYAMFRTPQQEPDGQSQSSDQPQPR